MRAFGHTLDEVVLRRDLTDRWVGRVDRVRHTLADGADASFRLGEALDAYYEGVCFAWALDEVSALSELREEISRLLIDTIDRLDVEEIRAFGTVESLAAAGVGADPEVLRRYGEILRDRARRRRDDRDPLAYREDLLDGLVALVVGEFGVAQAASVRLHEQLQQPRTPPSHGHGGLPHAIDAVARGDRAALADATGFATEGHARRVAPVAGRAADAVSALYPELCLVCRTGSWRGLGWPTSPYVLAVADGPGAGASVRVTS